MDEDRSVGGAFRLNGWSERSSENQIWRCIAPLDHIALHHACNSTCIVIANDREVDTSFAVEWNNCLMNPGVDGMTINRKMS